MILPYYAMYFLKLACGINYPNVYKNTTRGTIFTSYSDIYDRIVFENFYGLMVYSPLFVKSLIYLHIVMIGGGGAMW